MASNRIKRRTGGFTMVEAMVVLAIMVILMGVAFIAVWRYQRTMAQMNLDTSAKEIYIAAQNHLTAAKSQGLLESYSKSGAGTSEDATNDEGAIYYFIYDGSTVDEGPTNRSNALSAMLPQGSIDESLRTGGSYIVRYQPSSGKILEVFYAEPNGLGGFFGGLSTYAFANTAEEYNQARSVADEWRNGVKTTDNSEGRRHYGDNDVVIGYYGGEVGLGEYLTLEPPAIKVENGDTLKVTVTNTAKENKNKNIIDQYNTKHELTGDDAAVPRIVLMVEGAKSGAVMWFDISGTKGADTKVATVTANQEWEVVLDDVTQIDNATNKTTATFVDLINDRRTKGRLSKEGDRSIAVDSSDLGFILGEDLNIHAWITAKGAFSNVADSAVATANSLFDNGSSEKADETLGKTNYDAKIASFRHLINLDNAVSRFNRDYEEGHQTSEGNRYNKVTATQVSDLVWVDEALLNSTDEAAKAKSKGFVNKTKFYDTEGAGASAVNKAKPLEPVNPAYAITYVGRDEKNTKDPIHAISNVTVAEAETGANAKPAGLFGKLESGSEVKSLELVDFTVTSAGAEAGALVGKMDGKLTLTNVAVHDSFKATGAGASTVEKQPSKITGSVAGGLVGTAGANSVFDGCMAGVYVNATGNAAGGLVGSFAGTEIKNSYAAGHTDVGGKYAVKQKAEDPDPSNVIAASGSAGGLVGTVAGSAKVENCYATTSVSVTATTNSNAGGLVGSLAENAEVKNSYAGGLVAEGAANRAALVANAAGSAPIVEGCRYMSIVNPGLIGIGNKKQDGTAQYPDATVTVTKDANGVETLQPEADDRKKVNYAADLNLLTYREFTNAELTEDNAVPAKRPGAEPYDRVSTKDEDGKVTATCIAELFPRSETDKSVYYPLETVVMLSDMSDDANTQMTAEQKTKAPAWLTKHYGDWGAYETNVVNTKS